MSVVYLATGHPVDQPELDFQYFKIGWASRLEDRIARMETDAFTCRVLTTIPVSDEYGRRWEHYIHAHLKNYQVVRRRCARDKAGVFLPHDGITEWYFLPSNTEQKILVDTWKKTERLIKENIANIPPAKSITKTVGVSFRIPKDRHKQIMITCIRERTTLTALISDLLDEWLEAHISDLDVE